MPSGKPQREPNRRPTRNDVAALAGVSSAVVSYVVNDGPRKVAPATRQRVLDAVRELGYRPNDVARSLRAQNTNMIGLLGPSPTAPSHGVLAFGMGEALEEESHLLTVCNGAEGLESLLRCARLLIAKRVDGVVVAPIGDDTAELIAVLRHEQSPVVVAGIEYPDVPSVYSDPTDSGRVAVEHLVALGHRRIAVARRARVAESQARHRGYRQALKDAAIPFDPNLVINVNVGVKAGADALRALLNMDEPPSAVVTHDDLTALGVLEAAAEAGVRVPHDLSVVSTDNLTLGRHSQPSLTAVPRLSPALGRVAAEQLLLLIRGQKIAPSTKVEPQVVARASSGRVPRS